MRKTFKIEFTCCGRKKVLTHTVSDVSDLFWALLDFDHYTWNTPDVTILRSYEVL
jgi:hypothetical protein